MVSLKTAHVGSQEGYYKHSDMLAPTSVKRHINVRANGRRKLTDESIDVWYDSIIQKYEKRPMESMANITLADFARAHTKAKQRVQEERFASHSTM
jgi:hypothetical protein